MSSRRVTIVDIADELGISKSLVSNALHGRGRVSASTRDLVRETAERMGYVSNRAAQQLRSSRYGTLGFTVPPGLRALSFYMELTLGVSDACSEIGSDLMLYTRGDERSPVTMNVPIDGAIVCDPQPGDTRIGRFAQARVPVVTIGDVDPAQATRVAGTVSIDFGKVTAEVFSHLDESGESVRPVLLLVDLPVIPIWLQEVREAFGSECRKRGVEAREVRLPIRTDAPVAHGRQPLLDTSRLPETTSRLMEDSYTAWLVAFQGLASTLRGFAAERSEGRVSPRIVALPGDPMSDALDSRILSVDFRAHDYGATAVHLLHRVLRGDPAPVRHTTHRTELYGDS